MVSDKLRQLFDVFSKRRPADSPTDTVPDTLRNKVPLLCRDVFSGRWRDGFGQGDYTREFWGEMHRSLEYLHGQPNLSSDPRADNPPDDAILFLSRCSRREFLDFIELIFKVDCLFHVLMDENVLVGAINELFRSEGAPYQLTHVVKQEEEATSSSPLPFPGYRGKVIKTIAYPKVVRVDEEVTFAEAILPALSVLADPAYKSANIEFREALEDYRKGDYGDCLTKCGSAFESVMKVLCEQKGWPYVPQDTAGPLLKTVISNSGLDSFFEQPLLIIATLRNRLSKAHGAGAGTRQVDRHIAQYALTSTAASVLLLINQANQMPMHGDGASGSV